MMSATQATTCSVSQMKHGSACYDSLGWVGNESFQAPIRAGVPALIELGRLLQISVPFVAP